MRERVISVKYVLLIKNEIFGIVKSKVVKGKIKIIREEQ